MKKTFLEEYHDIFDICNRIKEIDSTYKLFFNRKEKRFEVYKTGDRESLAVVVPFDQIDERLVTHLKKTKVSRLEKLLKEIEDENKLLEEKMIKKIVNEKMCH